MYCAVGPVLEPANTAVNESHEISAFFISWHKSRSAAPNHQNSDHSPIGPLYLLVNMTLSWKEVLPCKPFKSCSEPWPGWLSWLEHCPVHHKVTGSVPCENTIEVAGSIPGWGAYRRQLINVSLSALPLTPTSSLTKINKHTLRWGLIKQELLRMLGSNLSLAFIVSIGNSIGCHLVPVREDNSTCSAHAEALTEYCFWNERQLLCDQF